jgi:hypothetical protein
MFIALPVIFLGFGLMKASEALTTKLVAKKGLKEFQNYVQDNPRFVLVPAKIYDSPIRMAIAEGKLPAPTAVRFEEQEMAVQRAKEILPLIPEAQLRYLLSQR